MTTGHEVVMENHHDGERSSAAPVMVSAEVCNDDGVGSA